MLKETETEETVVFFVTFLSLVIFQLGGAGPPGPPLATPMISRDYYHVITFFLVFTRFALDLSSFVF